MFQITGFRRINIAARTARTNNSCAKLDGPDFFNTLSQEQKVRPEGAEHQWRKDPPGELSVDLVADERCGRVTGRVEAW